MRFTRPHPRRKSPSRQHLHRPHLWLSVLIEGRLFFIYIFLIFLIVGIVAAMTTHSWVVLGVAMGMHLVVTTTIVLLVFQLLTEEEKPSAEVVARLEEEGVWDPERAFNDYLHKLPEEKRRSFDPDKAVEQIVRQVHPGVS